MKNNNKNNETIFIYPATKFKVTIKALLQWVRKALETLDQRGP